MRSVGRIEIGREEGIEIGREEGIEIGREEGIEIGREEGIDVGIKAVALALLQEGISEAVILKTTGLTAEQLAQLRRET